VATVLSQLEAFASMSMMAGIFMTPIAQQERPPRENDGFWEGALRRR